MSIRDKILSEQKENIVEKTAAAEKLKGLLHTLDKKVVGGVVGLQNFIDPTDAKRREKEGPDTMETPPEKPKPPKRPGEDRKSTNEDIAKLAEMLGKGVERHRGTDVPKKYSKTKGGTPADRKRLGRKAREGEKIVNLSRDLRAKISTARISTDEAFAEMTPGERKDYDSKALKPEHVRPSSQSEREKYAENFRKKRRGEGSGRLGVKGQKRNDLTLKDSTEFADSVMKNLGEASPPNRSTLKPQPKPLSKPREPAKVTPDKGLSPDARELLATKGLSIAIVGRRGPDGRPLDKSAGGISQRHAKAQAELVASGEIPPKKLREDSPPNRSTLKPQPIRRFTTNVSPDLRGKPQQHGGPGPESVGSGGDDLIGQRDRSRGKYPMPHGTTLKREKGDKKNG